MSTQPSRLDTRYLSLHFHSYEISNSSAQLISSLSLHSIRLFRPAAFAFAAAAAAAITLNKQRINLCETSVVAAADVVLSRIGFRDLILFFQSIIKVCEDTF